MAVVIAKISGNRYAYDCRKVKGKMKTTYIGPVDKNNRIRKVKYGGKSVRRAPIGTTVQSLREIYNKAVRKHALEEAERAKHNKNLK